MTTDSAQLNEILLGEGKAEPAEPSNRTAAPDRTPWGGSGADDVSKVIDQALPSASVQVVTVPVGLYAFRVRAGAPTRAAGPEGLLLPAMKVGLVPGQPADVVKYLPAPGTDGNWLCEPGHTVVAQVSDRPASFLLTSLRLPDGPLLSIAVDRLDQPNPDIGAGEQRLELPTEPATIDLPPFQPARAAAPPLAAAAKGRPDGLRLDIMAHVQRWGDTQFTDVLWAGHVGQRLWIEAFSVNPREGITADQIEYKGLTAAGYETPWLSNGAPCGTRGMAMPLVGFAVRIKPGGNAPAYDCEYSGAFISGATIGPRRNGAPCFSTPDDPLEAIQLKIVARGQSEISRAKRPSAEAKLHDDPAQSRAARGLLNWTQTDLVRQSGVSRNTIVSFERGLTKPSGRTRAAMIAAFEAGGIEFVNRGVRLRASASTAGPTPKRESMGRADGVGI